MIWSPLLHEGDSYSSLVVRHEGDEVIERERWLGKWEMIKEEENRWRKLGGTWKKKNKGETVKERGLRVGGGQLHGISLSAISPSLSFLILDEGEIEYIVEFHDILEGEKMEMWYIIYYIWILNGSLLIEITHGNLLKFMAKNCTLRNLLYTK